MQMLYRLLTVFTADSLTEWLIGWVSGAWMDLLVLLFILTYSSPSSSCAAISFTLSMI